MNSCPLATRKRGDSREEEGSVGRRGRARSGVGAGVGILAESCGMVDEEGDEEKVEEGSKHGERRGKGTGEGG